MSSSASLVETEDGFQPVFFEPRELRNLVLLDEMENLCPLMDMKVGTTIIPRASLFRLYWVSNSNILETQLIKAFQCIKPVLFQLY